jgi:hypothetical protein
MVKSASTSIDGRLVVLAGTQRGDHNYDSAMQDGQAEDGIAQADEVAMERVSRFVALGLGAVLFAILLVKAATLDWSAAGDFAVLRLRSLDVGTADTPLVGAYSRFGWNHPGPMLFFAYAPFVRAFGGGGNGILVGALFVNGAAIASSLWIAKRTSTVAMGLVGLVLSLVCLGFGTGELFDPWNPFVMILPLISAGVAAWRAIFGDRVASVVLVIAASFALQSHVGSAAIGATLFGIGGIAMVLRSVRGKNRGESRRTLLFATIALAVCWIPPVIDQIVHSPGNLRLLVSFFADNDEPVVGLSNGVRLVSHALTLPVHRDLGFSLFPGGPVSIPFAFFFLLVAAFCAWRRRWMSELSLCVIAFALIVASVVGASRVSGPAFPYLFRWVWVAGAFTWLAVGLVLCAELRARFSWGRQIPTVLNSLIAVVVLAMIVIGPDVSALRGWDNSLQTYSSVVEPTMDALRSAPHPTLITITLAGIDGTLAGEVQSLAEDEGIDVRRIPGDAYIFGSHRTIDPAQARSELVFASGDSVYAYAGDPKFRLVTSFDPLSPDERADWLRLSAIDWAQRPDGPSNPGDEYLRWRALSERYETISVFISETPPGG